jgi:hypothetical protein
VVTVALTTILEVPLIATVWHRLFPVRPVRFELNTGPAQVVERLRQRTHRTVFATVFRSGVVGRVSEDEVRLRYYRAWVHNDFAPVFTGRFVYEGGKPHLTGRFAVPIRTRIFFGFWCGFILVWWVVAASIALAGKPGIPLPIALLAPPAMIAFGVGITLFAQRHAAAAEQEIKRVVQEAIEQRAA